ncbi:Arginyl-tRNA--protein transferase 1 [Haplosporangium sp. Z 27]|nr:Arginyl-tRNA--protein transferase 1 [Haplosporangium sp. Z 27]
MDGLDATMAAFHELGLDLPQAYNVHPKQENLSSPIYSPSSTSCSTSTTGDASGGQSTTFHTQVSQCYQHEDRKAFDTLNLFTPQELNLDLDNPVVSRSSISPTSVSFKVEGRNDHNPSLELEHYQKSFTLDVNMDETSNHNSSIPTSTATQESPSSSPDSSPSSSTPSSPSPPSYDDSMIPVVACGNCKRSHIKCDHGRPCQNCRKNPNKAESCQDAVPKPRGRPKGVNKAATSETPTEVRVPHQQPHPGFHIASENPYSVPELKSMSFSRRPTAPSWTMYEVHGRHSQPRPVQIPSQTSSRYFSSGSHAVQVGAFSASLPSQFSSPLNSSPPALGPYELYQLQQHRQKVHQQQQLELLQKHLLNQGWRRFGLYLYKPNLRDRHNSSEFTPSKGQRRTIARLNRFIKNQYVPLKISRDSIIREDSSTPEEHSPSPEPSNNSAHTARRKSVSPPLGKSESMQADFIQNIHAADLEKAEPGSDWKQFKVVLEPATFSQEKFDLYCQYQKEIHHVPSSLLSRESFDSSVTRTPLSTEIIASDYEGLGIVGYGTYHQCYYVDNKLIAVSVLDILPQCVSSGYFYYDPSLSSLSLGRYSTLREIALVQEIKTIPGMESMEYYTMGHYVSSAPKTHYKATYHPSYLLDPETYGWVPFEKCVHILQSKQYHSFSDLELFHPRVKGLLITMVAEQRAREKIMGSSSKAVEEQTDTYSMETDTPMTNASGIQEHHRESGSDEEGCKRKRPQDGSPAPSEYMRSGKRPSLTPPPMSSLLPPPGMMDPNNVTDQDLSQLVIFQGEKAMMLTDSETFKSDKNVSQAMREYFAAVGPTLAPKMLIFAQ